MAYQRGIVLLDRTATLITVVSSTTITDVYNFSIPPNAMGLDGMLRLSLLGEYLNTAGVTSTLTVTVVFGGVTMFADATAANASSATVRPVNLQLQIASLGSVTSQYLNGTVAFTNVNAASTGKGDLGAIATLANVISGTSTVNTTSAQTLQVRVTHSVSNAATSFKRYYAVLELLT